MVVDSPYGGSDSGDKHRDQPPEHDSGELHGRPVKFEMRSRAEFASVSRIAIQRQALDGRRPDAPATERPEWQAALARGEVDRVGLGIVDERARAFLPKERRIASLLAEAGAAVIAVHDGYGAEGRKPDALVDDIYTEFKSLDPGASNKTVRSALKDAKGQAAHAVIDARDSGLSHDEAERGMRRFLGTPYGYRLDAIRIIGDDYDIDWRQG
jgi:hypothetical protein